ncbi:hypothetical protein [Rufibacter immobilis]|uniref:hypothetical protein n=1 Tax=Rufibacter immobilis TaxID=1348778 RepID=UPI0035EEF80E
MENIVSFMDKSKIDFIADLLNSDRLDTSHKEKFLTLAIEELRSQGVAESELNKRLESLEKIVNLLKESSRDPEVADSTKKEKIEHTPKKTVEALRLFDTSLKYFTHKWDRDEEEFDRKKEIKKASVIVKSMQVPKNLKQRITNFITKKRYKKEDIEPEWFVNYLFGKQFNSYYSWDNEKFISWFDNSISKDITSPEINDNMIDPFKHSIQIRDGKLENHISPLVRKVLYTEDGKTEFEIEYLNLEQAKFYTNTQELMRGIKMILEESILKYAKINDRYRVKIEYSDVDRTLRIIHIKSKCLSSSNNQDFLGGSFKDIRDNCFISLCNWSIEATFADGDKRLSVLHENSMEPIIEDLNYIPEGFTHILYFY